MKISNLGVEFIKSCEGCSLKAYIDTAGVRTIGYGHAYWEGEVIISEEKASELLKSDLKKFESAVEKFNAKYNWTQNEFDALVSFAFNLGGIEKLTADGTRSKKEISEKMLLYYNSGGKKIPGLVKRRIAEQMIFREGKYLREPYGNDMKAYYMLSDIKQEPEVVKHKTDKEIIKYVINGKYGTGEGRKRRLAEDGYDPDEVQGAINLIYGLKKKEQDLKKLKHLDLTLNCIINILGMLE